eukprot:8332858-Pyramimonas_sp.AAC.1
MSIRPVNSYRGRWFRNVPRRLQTLAGSLSDEGGGDIHCRSAIGVPLVSRPWIPYPTLPYPMPPHRVQRVASALPCRSSVPRSSI